MTSNYHTPIPEGSAADAATFNDPLGEMDEALTEALLEERDGHIIQGGGVDMAQQARLDFVGDGVTVENEVGKTKITIPGSTGGDAFRNLILNGEPIVAQNGVSLAGITAAGYYVADGWLLSITSLGTHTVSVENDAPAGSGHKKSYKILCTTADASPSATDAMLLQFKIEGQNLQHLMKGTAAARALAATIWVKSNLTGTYIVEAYDQDNTRSVSSAITISSANTWEQKSIAIPADTTGVLDNDVNVSFRLHIWLGAGSNFTSGTLQTTWGAVTTANRAVGQTNFAATINNYIQITGVQLELDAETDFEFLPWDVVYQRCRRLYRKTFAYGTAPAQNAGLAGARRFPAMTAGATVTRNSLRLEPPMRATPTVTFYNPSAANAQARDTTAGADCSSTAADATLTSADGLALATTGAAGSAAGNALDVHIELDARL